MKTELLDKKTYIKIIISLLVIISVTVFAKFDYFLYKDTIATVVKVENIKTSEGNDEREENYIQNLTLKIKNGKYKGKIVNTTNKYFYSQFSSTKYAKGNDVFVSINDDDDDDDELSVKVLRTKVDMYAAFVFSTFVVLTILLTKRKGILAIITLIVNIGIFTLALQSYIRSEQIEITTIITSAFFIVFTLFILNGFSKKSLGAIISSLITVMCIYIIYEVAYKNTARPSFELMNYIFGNENLDALFLASVVLGSLGAVMDVSITINSSVTEIINTAKEPGVKSMIKSVKEISYDIMGTMVNVLFFSYVSGSIPMFLIKIKNGYSFINIVRFDVVFELLRFLVGSIGIVLAIPISGTAAVVLHLKKLKKKNSREGEKNVNNS